MPKADNSVMLILVVVVIVVVVLGVYLMQDTSSSVDDDDMDTPIVVVQGNQGNNGGNTVTYAPLPSSFALLNTLNDIVMANNDYVSQEKAIFSTYLQKVAKVSEEMWNYMSNNENEVKNYEKSIKAFQCQTSLDDLLEFYIGESMIPRSMGNPIKVLNAAVINYIFLDNIVTCQNTLNEPCKSLLDQFYTMEKDLAIGLFRANHRNNFDNDNVQGRHHVSLQKAKRNLNTWMNTEWRGLSLEVKMDVFLLVMLSFPDVMLHGAVDEALGIDEPRCRNRNN